MTVLDFMPTWFLKNPHAQTIWPTIARRNIPLKCHHERVELPDLDFIDLIWDKNNHLDSEKPIVLIMHGMGGDIDSPYARGFMNTISNANWRPVFMHLRGASFEPNRLDRGYHSGETQDIAFIIQHLQKHHVPLCAIGVSLSGNILLKWLGETGDQNPLSAAIAISVPFELNHCVERMSQGFSKIYQYWLLRSLRFYCLRKYQNRPAPFDMDKAKKAKTFWDFDNVVTAPLHGFIDADDYYQQCSSRQFLRHIKKPTLIIHSKDDPFVPEHAIPSIEELSESTTLNLTQYGGHVGFVGSDHQTATSNYWLEQQIPAFLTEHLPNS